MSHQLHLQNASTSITIPSDKKIVYWINFALNHMKQGNKVVNCRIVDSDEMQKFNAQYRQKDKPTNVLSFPFEHVTEHDSEQLGDLLICAPIVEQEALAQQKAIEAHWAHMLVHGCLHLLGYDHINDIEAKTMESLEKDILKGLNFDNPYSVRES